MRSWREIRGRESEMEFITVSFLPFVFTTAHFDTHKYIGLQFIKHLCLL